MNNSLNIFPTAPQFHVLRERGLAGSALYEEVKRQMDSRFGIVSQCLVASKFTKEVSGLHILPVSFLLYWSISCSGKGGVIEGALQRSKCFEALSSSMLKCIPVGGKGGKQLLVCHGTMS